MEKVVQTELSESEYALLAAYAKAHGETLKESLRTAVRQLTSKGGVNPDDPLFKMFPLTKKPAKIRDASRRHDAYLYGWES